MTQIITVPQLGESITEATVVKWFKKIGDIVETDEPIVELETDKITLEVPARRNGVISEIYAQTGQIVAIKQKLCSINEISDANTNKQSNILKQNNELEQNNELGKTNLGEALEKILAPSVNKIVNENNIDINDIKPSGEKGRISKYDALKHVEKIKTQKNYSGKNYSGKNYSGENQTQQKIPEKNHTIVPMTRLRITIAKRLKKAQNEAAILSTFNDVDMTNIINIRSQYKQEFESKFKIKLGFMGFFVKAVVEALKQFPEINAEIQGDNIIYKDYYNIGVAVGGDKGLVVPVIKNAQDMSIADIEKNINQYAIKAKNNSISINDLTGGTFTISNGGVYGSLLSTPILNPPQSGILGMHRIQKKPVVIDDQIKIRHIMLIALSYDHRIVDGREAVTFLNKVKSDIQEPQRLLLGL